MSDDFYIDLSEVNRLAVDLDRVGGQVGAEASLIVRKTALDIEATSKAFAPVDTGALRNSIGHDIHGDGRFGAIEADIGPTVEYGAYVEFGTSRMAPSAYMGPALDRHSPAFVEALERIGGRAL